MTLPLPVNKIIKIYILCSEYYFFHYDGIFINKHLQIRSPPTGVIACLFLEFLESGHFKFIIPSNDLIKITDKLNKIKLTIDFTYEVETKITLLFI